MTLPSANQFPAIAYQKGLSERAYPTYSEFLWDVVPIIRAEVQALVGDGVKYIQIDAPRYSYYIDPKWRDYVQNEMGVDPEAALDEAIQVDNACVDGARRAASSWPSTSAAATTGASGTPRAATTRSPRSCSTSSNVDPFLLEYESERAGTLRAAALRAAGTRRSCSG